MQKETLARIVVIIVVFAALSIPLVAWQLGAQGTAVHARMAETGGWTPESLMAEVGKPLHLRLTSDDVTHGFAVGQSSLPPVDVKPGEMTELILTFDKPGRYTFYCTRWCSVNHWRMRGTIEVRGSDNGVKEPVAQPLYVTLGLDIDVVNHSNVIPALKPSSARGAALVADHSLKGLIAKYRIAEYYLSHSPLELWKTLRAGPDLLGFSDQDIWDLVAYVWRSNLTPQALQAGKQLYAANCAACHGEKGGGDGVFASQLANTKTGETAGMKPGEMTTRPADFTNSAAMLSANPARLQGKILRGGMGTGMPYWGPVFTEDQTWDLVDYLWAFQFDLEYKP
jgi:mono/diheme cytochrome c family protein